MPQIVKDFDADEKNMPPRVSTAKNPNKNIARTSSKINNPGEIGTLAIPSNLTGNLEELEEKVKSMMEKTLNRISGRNELAYRCKVCGKEGQQPHMKDHIEANHLEGIVIPCNLCDKTFRSRNGVRLHKRQHQKH